MKSRNRRFLALSAVLGVTALAVASCAAPSREQAAKHLKRGKELLAKNDPARALLEFRNASRVVPGDAEPYYQQGLAYLAASDARNAFQAFRKATELDPKHTAAQLRLAELEALSRDPRAVQQAAERLSGIMGVVPESAGASDLLAFAEWQLGKREDARKRLEEVLAKFPQRLQSSVTLARMRLAQKDSTGAEATLRDAVAHAPQSAPAALALARLYIVLENSAKAEPEVKRALELDPNYLPALMTLGELQAAAGRLEEAERTFQRLASSGNQEYGSVYGVFLYRTGKRDAALAEFARLAQADPNDRQRRTQLVAAYIGTKRLEDAERVLEAALKRNGRDTEALLQRAQLRLQRGDAARAASDAQAALKFATDAAGVHLVLAAVHRFQGKDMLERNELESALRLDAVLLPARVALARNYVRANQSKAGMDILADAPADQKNDPSWIATQNWVLLALGNLQEAKAGIGRLAAIRGGPEATLQKGVVSLTQRDYRGARAAAEELLNRDSQAVGAIELFMETHVAEAQLAEGIRRLKEIAARQPNSPAVQYSLGRWLLRARNVAEARTALESALRLNPGFLPADIALAEIELRGREVEAGRRRLEKIVAHDRSNVPALLLLASADQGDSKAAISRYQAVLAVDRQNPVALNNLAHHLTLQDPDEALKYAQQAAELAPENPYIVETLGWILYRKGSYGAAIPYLKKAVERGATPARQYHLALCYIKAGQRELGLPLLQTALQQKPDLPNTEHGW
jgi:tetratricopeptide (TPR) repeat protein